MPPSHSPNQAPAQSASARTRSLRARLVLWLTLPLVVYVAADGWLGFATARHSADLVHFHALDITAQMISGRIEWDEDHLRVSVPLAASTVFVMPETPVHGQATHQVSTEHGRLLTGRFDFDMRPASDTTGLADAGAYTDTVEDQPVHVVTMVRTMYDAGRTERVVTHVTQTMNRHDAMIRQLW